MERCRPTLFTRLLSVACKDPQLPDWRFRNGQIADGDNNSDDANCTFVPSLKFLPISSAADSYETLFSAGEPINNAQTVDWFFQACADYLKCLPSAESNIWNSGTNPTARLASDIISLCQNHNKAETLEASLYDLLGESGWELMRQVLASLEDLKQLKSSSVEFARIPPAVSDATDVSFELDHSVDWLQRLGFDDEYLAEERRLGLQKGNHFDHWRDGLAPAGSTEFSVQKSRLPSNAVRTLGHGFEEIYVPAAKRPPPPRPHDLINVKDFPEWMQSAFPFTEHLNRIQSVVFPCAFQSNENMLVCAPTGAGKTNIAMLALLQLLNQKGLDGMRTAKAIYIAPMKALAQEVVTKFSQRLQPLKMIVREYTGDVQLSKQEITESHLLVCTPEKYDSATRKGGDGSFGTLVSLIIIDEVHLLADERGAVIETIVARTQRLVESSQKIVRIVGLSATLPNYKDVASFLRVNESSGLFHFGPEFRPIPLDQSFVGLTDKSRAKRADIMNMKAYDKMVVALEANKQVMIFVHARRETSKTIEAMLDLSSKFNTHHLLENNMHDKFALFTRQVDRSRSSEVQQLFYRGVGVHHAGMLRTDRSLVEQMFECGLLKVLCCTATLAWGVNLPAHTVIIKGTEMYDPERGGFVDLSVLDVLQIFGRAGRPQYDNSGHAVLITQQKSLYSYLGLLAQQTPIESALIKALVDHMNAEIVNGTINNTREAMVWLSYTFLFVRMKRNPLAYGLKLEELFDDPQLEAKRRQLVTDAAEELDRCMMARFDKRSGNLAVTDLGRIASHYYIKHDTIQSFNALLSPHMMAPEAMQLLCSSSEFDQLKVRPDELAELDHLKKAATVPIKGDDTASKVNVLLQSFLSQSKINSFTLQSDSNYVAQNGSRIARALFEVCLKRGWSSLAKYYLTLCKCIDRRVAIGLSPLRQFASDRQSQAIPAEVFKRLEDSGVDHQMLLEMHENEIGQLIHNHKLGARIKHMAKQLPMLGVQVKVQPITKGIVRIKLTIATSFEWVDRFHGTAESFWLWIEDSESEYIYHAEHVVVQRNARHEERELEVTIPVRDPLPTQYYVRVVSDMWVGCETVIPIPFGDVSMPQVRESGHTSLLDVHPVPVATLRDELFESLYPFSHFNPVQSQAFYALFHTDRNVLVGAPTGSGKTIFAEMAILRLLKTKPGAKIVYVAPLKALARERLADWRRKLGVKLGLSVLELTGEFTPEIQDLRKADVLIVTPEKWDSISRGWRKRDYVAKVALVIIDEIHLLGVDRGPVLEVLLSRMRFIASQTGQDVRFVGLSTALANARDLADWMGIEAGTEHGAVGLYNFRPSVRPVPMTIHIQGFPGKHYCPRMATMNKPAYAAILEHSPTKPVLIFVSSRRQTRLTALDMISYCAADDDPKRFLGLPEDEIALLSHTVSDQALRDCLAFGVGIHHAGLDQHDRTLVEELFAANKIQVLVCTSTLAWGVNLPCHLVIVKGTEYFDCASHSYVDFPVTDILQMIGRAGRPQFDSTAVACIFVHETKKQFYRKFLHEPFPVESSLHLQLHAHINAEVANETLRGLGDVLEYMTWTYLYRRLLANPTYYGAADSAPASLRDYLLGLVTAALVDLSSAGCVTAGEDGWGAIASTFLGQVASFYYLHYRTPAFLLSRLLAAGSGDCDLWPLLWGLCSAEEFAKLPVRHNEEELNAELSVAARAADTSVSLADMSSPHVKAFLLLLAHLRRIRLPIADYINDLKSVLDQVPRVLNAMIDIAAEYELLAPMSKLIVAAQAIRQAVDPTLSAAELRQLPGLFSAEASGAVAAKLRDCGAEASLRGLLAVGANKCGLKETARAHLAALFASWDGQRIGAELHVDGAAVAVTTVATASAPLLLPPGARCELAVSFPHMARSPAPGRPGGKSTNWWLVVSAGEAVLAVRKLRALGVVRVTFAAPGGDEALRVTLHSDSALGMDRSFMLSAQANL